MICDLIGRLVLSINTIENQTLDISDQPLGIYYIRMVDIPQ
jgi:hypothetical protein